MNGLDLFSGIAGNTLGLREYVNTIAYCEQDRHAQSVLLSRMEQGLLKPTPIWDDITTLKGDMFDVPIDIIIGGFPCQDISVAGHGKGLAGERSGLFFEVCRLVKEIKPSFVFLENVAAIRTRGLREVIREFTDMGYDCRWTCVSAAEVGAPHLRKRWFLLAYSVSNGRRALSGTDCSSSTEYEELQQKNKKACADDITKVCGVLADSNGNTRQPPTKSNDICPGWETEPNVGRVVDGLPLRVDRIKRLGNAVVPEQAKKAFEKLMGIL